jgi:flagellar protein FlaG
MTTSIPSNFSPAPVLSTAAGTTIKSNKGGKTNGAPQVQVPHAVIEAPKENTAVPKFDPEQFQKQLEEVVKRLNEQMKDYKRDLGFSVDNRINTFIVTVRNTNTGEVIRQIPNEVIVKFAHSLEDLKGILFNGKT